MLSYEYCTKWYTICKKMKTHKKNARGCDEYLFRLPTYMVMQSEL